MVDVRPFRALRANPAAVERVLVPPYDVLPFDEALQLAQDPLSFVHVTRSEVNLPAHLAILPSHVHRTARLYLDQLRDQGVMQRDEAPSFYLYGLQRDGHEQLGIIGACAVRDYLNGRIRAHESTRPSRENERADHMRTLEAQVGLVFLTYRHEDGLDSLMADIAQLPPDWVVTTADDTRHRFWVVPEVRSDEVRQAFRRVPRLYIADGHHRSAAAARVHLDDPTMSNGYFLAGLYPENQLRVLAYHRVLRGVGPLDHEALLAHLARTGDLTEGMPVPSRTGVLGVYAGGGWHRWQPAVHPKAGDVEKLDIQLLQDLVLGPFFGIDDPRRDDRLQYSHGARQAAELQTLVDDGEAQVVFHVHPTDMSTLFRIADAGRTMPPKSTWFEPKLSEGVVVRLLDDTETP